jgi:hypothetical protein
LTTTYPSTGSSLQSNGTISLVFNQPVSDVRVNGVPAEGSGITWSAPAESPVTVTWINEDGSEGGPIELAYIIIDPDAEPPVLVSSTVQDGDIQVDPSSLNASGIVFEYNEPIFASEADCQLFFFSPEFPYDMFEDERVGGWLESQEDDNKVRIGPGPTLENGTGYFAYCGVLDPAGNVTISIITFYTIGPAAGFSASPSSGGTVAPNAPITLTFDAPVEAVVGATGSGAQWQIPAQPTLEINWTNTDGTPGGPITLEYTISLPELNLGLCGSSACREPLLQGRFLLESDADIDALNATVSGECFDVVGNLNIRDGVTSLAGLEKLNAVAGVLDISRIGGLTSLQGLDNLSSVGRLFISSNKDLTSLTNLENLSCISGEI